MNLLPATYKQLSERQKATKNVKFLGENFRKWTHFNIFDYISDKSRSKEHSSIITIVKETTY